MSRQNMTHYNSNREANDLPAGNNRQPIRRDERNTQSEKSSGMSAGSFTNNSSKPPPGSSSGGNSDTNTSNSTKTDVTPHVNEAKSEIVKTEFIDHSEKKSSTQKVSVRYNTSTADGKKKFTGRCRLFFGNIPINFSEADFGKLLIPYGESDDIFLNAKKGFGFVKLETRAAAEACKNGLDGIELQGKCVRVRYATHSAALQVRNLTPHCTNETLSAAFQLFGDVERAVVVVDDRGKSTGTGIVEFARRAAFTKALDSCTNGVFLISKSLRPVVVEPLDQKDEEDGLPERFALKNADYHAEVSVPPRLADPGSYEYDIGIKWKALDKVEAEKKQALEEEMEQKRLELEMDVEAMIDEHKANLLRQEMLNRQAELNALELQRRHREEQKQKELEMRRQQLKQQQQMGNSRNMSGNNMMMGRGNPGMGRGDQMVGGLNQGTSGSRQGRDMHGGSTGQGMGGGSNTDMVDSDRMGRPNQLRGANLIDSQRQMGGHNQHPSNSANQSMMNRTNGPNQGMMNRMNEPNQGIMGGISESNQGMPGRMNGPGPNQGMMGRMNGPGPNIGMMDRRANFGRGGGSTEQDLMLQQQQALREMHMKQQQNNRGVDNRGVDNYGNKPMVPPPQPPGFIDGRDGTAGRVSRSPMMGGMNRGGGDSNMMMSNARHMPPSVQSMSANQQQVRQQVTGMMNNMLQQQQQQQRQQEQQRIFIQQQRARGNMNSGGPDMKRPRRFQ